jgi:hypothetical protein
MVRIGDIHDPQPGIEKGHIKRGSTDEVAVLRFGELMYDKDVGSEAIWK